MGPQDKSNGWSTTGVKYKSICNDSQGRRSIKPVVGWTTQGRIDCKIKVKIYSTIPKKDGLLWLVQNYRKLNQVTIKDKTPLPLIEEVINKLKEAKYFNKLDLI